MIEGVKTLERVSGAGAIPPEVREGERSEPDRAAGGIAGENGGPPNPEVPAAAKRRQFSAEYKRRILKEADRCRQPGEIGALLRREGLYSSHLTTWRKARDRGELAGLRPKKRGAKPDPEKVVARETEKLNRENARLKKKLEQAELIIEVQKKVSKLLGIQLEAPELGDGE